MNHSQKEEETAPVPRMRWGGCGFRVQGFRLEGLASNARWRTYLATRSCRVHGAVATGIMGNQRLTFFII